MADYLTPGVYVEEVSAGPRPIESVGTSTAAFLGRAPVVDAQPHRALAMNNWAQFVRTYCKEGAQSTPLAQAVYGFFENGGQRCFVVNVGNDGIAGGVKAGQRFGIAVLEEVDEVAIVAAPGYADAASWDALLTHCEKLRDRVAVLDAPQDVDDFTKLTQVATAEPTPRRARAAVAAAATGAGGAAGGGGAGGGGAGGDAGTPPAKGLRARASDGGYGAFYFPWITTRDPIDGELVNVPPSGHIAGIYARTDATRGVHKAPANEVVRGALNVAYRVTREDQGALNPNGVNVIRFFPDAGIRVWGARTLADSASEWRYVNVRRLFNMVEESVGRATRWVVFEPNDQTLWKSIRRDVGAYLTRLWRSGALMGATPEEAFFVKCDEETNPQDVIDAGMVVTLIGIAPVKPAEFVIFRIGQHASGTEVQTGKES